MNTQDKIPNVLTQILVEAAGFEGFAQAMQSLKVSGVINDTLYDDQPENLVGNHEVEILRNSGLQEISALPAELKNSPDLAKLVEALRTATSPGALRVLISQLPAAIQQATEWALMQTNLNDQQAQQQLHALWGRLDQLNNEMSDTVRNFLTENERKEEARLLQLQADAMTLEEKEAAQKALLHFYKEKGIGLQQSDDPNAQAAGKRLQQKVSEAETILEKAFNLSASKEEDRRSTKGNLTTSGIASIFDDPEPGNLTANIPPQPRSQDSGRGV